MKFFYNNKPIEEQKELVDELFLNGSEFSHVLFSKMSKINQNLKFGYFQGTKNGKPTQLFCLIKSEGENNNSFFLINGERVIIKNMIHEISKKYEISDLSFEILKSPGTINNYFNVKKYNKAEEILKDFYSLDLDISVKDKIGGDYRLVIVSNSDMTIGEHLHIDELMLFQGETKIGYLKAKYTTPNIMLQHGIDPSKKDHFKNEATVDFSRVTPEHMNKGLGYVMYFHMAKHLNAKGISFRQSTICSNEAKRLWNGITHNWNEQVFQKDKKSFDKKVKVSFLSIGQDCLLYFKNRKPHIVNKPKI
jgi:hypothetical protein